MDRQNTVNIEELQEELQWFCIATDNIERILQTAGDQERQDRGEDLWVDICFQTFGFSFFFSMVDQPLCFVNISIVLLMEYWHTQVRTWECTNLLHQFQYDFVSYINPEIYSFCSLRTALRHIFFYIYTNILNLLMFFPQDLLYCKFQHLLLYA